MKILVLDNTIDPSSWGATNILRFARLAPEATFHVRKPPLGDFPGDFDAYDRMILTGSRTSVMDQAPWITTLVSHIRDWVRAGRPYLGVCYGHQILALAMGGPSHVGKAKTPEMGWVEIEQTARSPLLDGLPEKFFTMSRHYDEVTRAPAGFFEFAKSKTCGIQGIQLTGKPVYGIQFHPEKAFTEGVTLLKELKQRKESHLFQHYKDGKKYYDPRIGETIFGNFLK
jgi:GMP synthase-like glutamine amidotransferase